MNDIVLVLTVAAVATTAVLHRIVTLETRVDTLTRLEGKLDALLAHVGVQYDPYQHVPEAVAASLARGEKIQAIKDYRAVTGAGLKEAKEFVENVQRRAR